MFFLLKKKNKAPKQNIYKVATKSQLSDSPCDLSRPSEEISYQIADEIHCILLRVTQFLSKSITSADTFIFWMSLVVMTTDTVDADDDDDCAMTMMNR